jgi:misacylated tRNA(Ala) deacylase
MNTDLLYHADSYARNFNARVIAQRENAIALACTAFYPGGGGQMADRGIIRWADQERAVTGLRKDEEGTAIWHELDGPLPPVGAEVEGILDWEFRYQMMRTHTALHILCGLIFRNYGAQVTGGQMYPDRARMDFTLERFDQATIRAIEESANAAVQAALPIKVYVLPREEAFKIPDLIRTKINLLADGGTHVHDTSEVKGIKVLKTENKGKINKRLEIGLLD